MSDRRLFFNPAFQFTITFRARGGSPCPRLSKRKPEREALRNKIRKNYGVYRRLADSA